MRVPVTVYLGLGSNLGDRLNHLQQAVEQLQAHPEIRVTRVSSIYETVPVGPVEQPDFLNMVVAAETTLAPEELLSAVQEIEQRLHRVRTIRWGPRTLDIDILLYGERVLRQEGLTLPHPRMEERAFVLIPLLEVAGNLRIPGSGATVQARLEAAPDRSGVRKTPYRMNLTPVVG
ncbi:2-amino-4-hydroxy-6-hydroxymethyldihydropteridine diphosphokinase [Klebsiella pneumoniae]|nr:2-amino-4-hydroxy-6-hydroxymethyldihydropteridine diphosphokinase [Klebsiella pneumoniae]